MGDVVSFPREETFGVTPPEAHENSAVRSWLESLAREKGWRGLRWSEETDQHGKPMGRLLGRRPNEAG